jgi:hypothetical protein
VDDWFIAVGEGLSVLVLVCSDASVSVSVTIVRSLALGESNTTGPDVFAIGEDDSGGDADDDVYGFNSI